MYIPRTGIWSLLVTSLLLTFGLGCAGGGAVSPTLPQEGSTPVVTQSNPDTTPFASTEGYELWGVFYMVVDESDLTIKIIPNRTTELHWDVTWVTDIWPECVKAEVEGYDPNTRTFWIKLYTQNPTFKMGYDVRFAIDLDGTGEYDMLDPDNYTKLFDGEGLPNPFRALAKEQPNRTFMPKANHVTTFMLYISEDHSPVAYIPFIIEASHPNRCLEPYMITDIEVDGEFPPGGGGSVTIDLVVWDSQDDHGEVYLRTSGIFTVDDILMTPGPSVGNHGKGYTATFSNTIGGGSGLVKILIEAYTADTDLEPYPMNDYAPIFADPGGESAIAGDVFDALNKLPGNTAVVTIHNTGGGADPLPYTITDGTYFVPVLAGNYAVDAVHNLYQKQDTLYDVIVPPETTVLVCFGLAPKWLAGAGEGLATISGVVRNSTDGEPIFAAGVTLDGGPELGGVIQARNTDLRGHYCFYAVPTEQQDNWTVHCFHSDYLPKDYENVPSAKNMSTPQIDFDLVPVSQDYVWFEDFEAGPSNVGTQEDWYFERVVTDGWPGGSGVTDYHDTPTPGDNLWRVIDPSSPPILDTFYDNGICTIPPDDTSGGYMTEAFEGHKYLWYGEDLDETPPATPHSGSFIDEWDGGTMGGGRSANGPNACVAKTGAIDLSGYDELTLTLQTWWGIEAVDPSIMYDAMDILISTDGVAWDRLDRLNPLAEPIPDGGNAAKAYTSAGFFMAPVWAPILLDISDYGGNSEVYLRLDFDTRDALYNGFRGWVVDDMVIWPYTID